MISIRLLFVMAVILFTAQLSAQNVNVLDVSNQGNMFMVENNADGALDVTESYTVEFWIYVPSSRDGGFDYLLGRGNANDAESWKLQAKEGSEAGNFQVQMVTNDGTQNYYLGTPDIPTDSWHFLSFSYDASVPQIVMHVDGTAAVSQEDSSYSLPASTQNLEFFNYSGGGVGAFQGALDELRFSNIARYANEDYTVTTETSPLADDANTIILFNFDDNTALPPASIAANYTFSVINGDGAAGWKEVKAGNYLAYDDPSFSESLPLFEDVVVVPPADQNVNVLDVSSQGNMFMVENNADGALDVTESYTVEFWIYVPSSRDGGFDYLLGRGNANDAESWKLQAKEGSEAGNFQVQMVTNDGTQKYYLGTPDIPTDSWHFLSFSYDASVPQIVMHVDGTAAVSQEDSSYSLPASTQNLEFFNYSGGGVGAFQGALDELRFSNIARYANEDYTVTTETSPLADDANTIILFNFDDNTALPPASIAANYTFSVINGDGAAGWKEVKAGNYLAYDDPSFSESLPLFEDVVVVPPSADQNVNVLDVSSQGNMFMVENNADGALDVTESYTVEFWIYVPSSRDGGYDYLLGRGNANDAESWKLQAKEGSEAGNFQVQMVTNDGTQSYYLGTPDIPTDSWHFLSFSYDASVPQIVMHVDGTAAVSQEDSSYSLPASTQNLEFFNYSGGGVGAFQGALDELRFSNIARYANEDYTVTTETSPLADDANTILFFNFDDNTALPPASIAANYTFSVINGDGAAGWKEIKAGNYLAYDDPSFSESLPLFKESGGGTDETIITNGGFESSNLGEATTASVEGWIISNNENLPIPNVYTIIDSVVQEGQRALQVNVVSVGENTWDGNCVADSIHVVPGKDYVYSVWAKAQNPGAKVNFTLGRYDYAEIATIRPAELTTEWQEFTMQFTVEEGLTLIRGPIHFGYEDNVGNVIYIDNMKLEELKTAWDGPPLASGHTKFLGNIYKESQSPSFLNYWNQVTPGNAGKWGSVEKVRDVMKWENLDAAYNLAKDNGFPFVYHVLLWSNQQPPWIETLPEEEQLEEIEEWFAAVAERYPDIDYLQVVNEAVNNPPIGAGEGNYMNALGGTNDLYDTGWDWVIKAFELAKKHFPTTKLMINDYHILSQTDKRAKYLTIINLLQERGLIDGIGVQGHAFSTRGTASDLTESLDALAATGLPIQVTELDIDGPTDEIQAAEYARVFPVLWEHPAVEGITLWGWLPGLWRHEEKAYIINPDGSERPAMEWLHAYFAGLVVVPETPVLISPVDESVITRTPTFIWHKAENADWYNLRVSKKPDFFSILVDTSITDTTFTPAPLDSNITYYWRVSSGNKFGTSANALYGPLRTTEVVSGVDENENTPTEFNLMQNYPNPFNPTTLIRYAIPTQTFVTVKVFDVLGREVATLVNEEKAIGFYELEWNASRLSSGIYFYTIMADDFVAVKKMLLIK